MSCWRSSSIQKLSMRKNVLKMHFHLLMYQTIRSSLYFALIAFLWDDFAKYGMCQSHFRKKQRIEKNVWYVRPCSQAQQNAELHVHLVSCYPKISFIFHLTGLINFFLTNVRAPSWSHWAFSFNLTSSNFCNSIWSEGNSLTHCSSEN